MLEEYIKTIAFYDELNKIAAKGEITKSLADILKGIGKITGKGVKGTGRGLSATGKVIEDYPLAALGIGVPGAVAAPHGYRKGKEKVRVWKARQLGGGYY